MSDKYQLCSCGSGKKFKFCCHDRLASWRGMSERELFRRAAELPVVTCRVARDWGGRGLAQVIVFRQIPDDSLLACAYLVDTFRLGVKDTFVARLESHGLQPFLDDFQQAMEEVPYEDARSLILGAVEFAKKFGHDPGESWADHGTLVEPGRPYDRKYQFGMNGSPNAEPFFIEWCDEVCSLMEDGHLDDAWTEIEEMLRACPGRWESLYLQGTCLIQMRKPELAIPLLNQAVAIEPAPQAYLNLAIAHQTLFNVADWLTCLKCVVDLDGEAGPYGEAAQQILDEYTDTVREIDGISLDEFIEGNRIFDRAFENLTAGRYHDSIDGFSGVLKVRPRHVQSYGNLGLAYAGIGDRDRAIACLDKAIELDPLYEPAISNRRVLQAAQDIRIPVQSMKTVDSDRDQWGPRRKHHMPVCASPAR